MLGNSRVAIGLLAGSLLLSACGATIDGTATTAAGGGTRHAPAAVPPDVPAIGGGAEHRRPETRKPPEIPEHHRGAVAHQRRTTAGAQDVSSAGTPAVPAHPRHPAGGASPAHRHVPQHVPGPDTAGPTVRPVVPDPAAGAQHYPYYRPSTGHRYRGGQGGHRRQHTWRYRDGDRTWSYDGERYHHGHSWQDDGRGRQHHRR